MYVYILWVDASACTLTHNTPPCNLQLQPQPHHPHKNAQLFRSRELGLPRHLRLLPLEPAPRWGPRALAASSDTPIVVRDGRGQLSQLIWSPQSWLTMGFGVDHGSRTLLHVFSVTRLRLGGTACPHCFPHKQPPPARVPSRQAKARGKVTADVMEALVGAAYVTDDSARRLAGQLLSMPPPGRAADGNDDSGTAAGGAAALQQAAAACGGGGAAAAGGALGLHAGGGGGGGAPPPLPLAPDGLLRAARMCANLGLLPPGGFCLLCFRVLERLKASTSAALHMV